MSDRPASTALALFIGVPAAIWGVALVVDPSGDSVGLPTAALEHASFSTFLIPGLVLALVVGGSQLSAAAAHLRRRTVAPLLSGVAGVLVLGWLVVQIAMLREFGVMQALIGLPALAQLVLAVRGLGRDQRRPGDAEAEAFLQNRRIALVGLSTKPGAFSGVVADALRSHGHEVLPVNPRAAAAGEPGYAANLADLLDPPHAALLMVAPPHALRAVQDCVAAGVSELWFHRGAGPGSASPAAVDLALRADLRVVTDACPLMYLSPVGWMHRAHRNLATREGQSRVA